jgi:hypothetical protein
VTPRRAAVVLAVVGVAAAGCGSSSAPSGGGSPTPTPRPSHTHTRTPSSPPVTVTASASATKTVTPTPTPTHHVGPCATSQLSLTLGSSQGAAGSFYTPVILTNTGSTTCTVFGYPGVSYINAAGAQVGFSAARESSHEAVVTVKPGHTASALLHQPNPLAFPPADCHRKKTTGVRVFPPGQTAALTVASKNHVCTTAQGRSDVTAMQSGSNPEL